MDYKTTLDAMGFKKRHFIVPTILSTMSAIFEGLIVIILIPFLEGTLYQDFTFLKQSQYYPLLVQRYPGLFETDLQIFITLLLSIFVLSFFKNLFTYLASVTFAAYATKNVARLRNRVMDTYLSFGKQYFDERSKGELMTILTTTTQSLANMIMAINHNLAGVIMAVIYLVVMVGISLKLTVTTLVFFVPFLWGVKKLIENIKRKSKQFVVARKKMVKKANNILSTIPLVKAYSNEVREMIDFGAESENLSQIRFNMIKRQALIWPLQDLLMTFAIMVLTVLIAALVISGEKIQVSEFLVFFYMIKRSESSLFSVNQIRSMLAEISGQIDEINEVFSIHGKHRVSEGKRKLKTLKTSIRVKKLTFSYKDEVNVLEDVSFTVSKGKTVALVGETGSGKTTIAHLLMRYYDCPPGSILVDKTDIRKYCIASLMKNIALVSQDIQLTNDTLRKNLLYGLKETPSKKELEDVLKKARLTDYVKKMPHGLETLIGEDGVKLSGGEKQRVSIARALLKKAQILILDEATSSLDSNTEELIQQAIEEALAGKTSLVIAHRLSTIKNADKIVVLDKGKKVEEGKLEALLSKKSHFYKLWKQQKFG